jgi:GATA zinc finger
MAEADEQGAPRHTNVSRSSVFDVLADAAETVSNAQASMPASTSASAQGQRRYVDSRAAWQRVQHQCANLHEASKQAATFDEAQRQGQLAEMQHYLRSLSAQLLPSQVGHQANRTSSDAERTSVSDSALVTPLLQRARTSQSASEPLMLPSLSSMFSSAVPPPPPPHIVSSSNLLQQQQQMRLFQQQQQQFASRRHVEQEYRQRQQQALQEQVSRQQRLEQQRLREQQLAQSGGGGGLQFHAPMTTTTATMPTSTSPIALLVHDTHGNLAANAAPIARRPPPELGGLTRVSASTSAPSMAAMSPAATAATTSARTKRQRLASSGSTTPSGSIQLKWDQWSASQVPEEDRVCEQCNTRNTPEWRRGPNGPKTLCNACGLKYSRSTREHN